jgi:hypothetical protein
MQEEAFRFPVLCFWRDLIRIRRSWELLTTTTRAGIKNGMFRDLLLVDSDGLAVRVKDAHKLHGVGLFRGYNIFLNQRIKVKLELSGDPFRMQLDDVRQMVLKSFQSRRGWSSRDDFDELKASIENARSIPEIIERLSEPNPP